ISIIFLVGISYAATRRMKLVPSRLQTVVEAIIGRLLDFCQDIAGKKYGRRFFPMVATIFLFIIANAWLSLIPGYGSVFVTGTEGEAVHLLRGANTDINLPLALALVSFVFVEYWGIKVVGIFHSMGKFFNTRQFSGGVRQVFGGKVKEGLSSLFNGAIDIFIGFIELLSEFVRILSFTFRLFGNMTGGEILLLMMFFLAPFILAIPFYGLELLVGFIQALIFGGLTLVFATIAITPPHTVEEH
ncbi:MAG: F0F1 ATP synthase subunit A, partial [Dehalococcoidales bacterium]